MGKDNIFHLKKERKARELARQINKRSPYDSVLIICEGEKTEVNYFRNLISIYRLNSANVEVLPCKKGSAPISIVDYAVERSKSQPYLDRVYCVFDRDNHNSFDQAIEKLKRLDQQAKRKKPRYFSAISIPCFEFWFLLHFKYTTKQYSQTQNCSMCDNLIAELRQHLPSYTKNTPNLFAQLEQHLPAASRHAAQLRQENDRMDTDNPSTNVDEVVQYLIELKTLNHLQLLAKDMGKARSLN